MSDSKINPRAIAIAQNRLDELEALRLLDAQDQTFSVFAFLFTQITALMTFAVVAITTASLYTSFVVGVFPGAPAWSDTQIAGMLLFALYPLLLRSSGTQKTHTNWRSARQVALISIKTQLMISLLTGWAYGVGAIIQWAAP
jgi:hypothetical protein